MRDDQGYWLGMFGLLGFLAQAARADDIFCPPLSTEVVDVTCDKAGTPVPCHQADANTKARMMWKTSVISPNKNINRLVCRPGGVWEQRKPSNRTAGNGIGAPASPAPPDYVALDRGHYKLTKNEVGCREAEKRCQAEGAKLIVIETNEELKAIKEYVKRESVDVKLNGFFIGVVTKDFVTYTTIHGAPFPIKWVMNWAKGEPSKQKHELCFFANVNDFKAHDMGESGEARSYICEFSATG